MGNQYGYIRKRPEFPIIYSWMKNINDTNSGLPLIGVEMYDDWVDVECPNCKEKYELEDSHIEYYKKNTKAIYILLGVVLGVLFCQGARVLFNVL